MPTLLFMFALVPHSSRTHAFSHDRPIRPARVRVAIWGVLAGLTLVAAPLGAQSPPPSAGDRDLPVSVAEDLLDNALAQEVGGSQQPARLLRRSGTGKVGLILILAAGLVGMRVLYVRRASSPTFDESETEPPPLPEETRTSSRERLDRSVAGGRRSYRPYRTRNEKATTPLTLPPHVLEILARTSAPADPAGDEPAPYHATDGETPPPSSDAPSDQRLDLLIPGFTPWRNKKK